MTEPRDPPPPDPEEPGHPHGLAEEIREEIAVAVEHVPKPVRWTVGKIAWLVVLGVALLVVLGVGTVLLVLAHRTTWVAKEFTLFANQALATRSDVVLEVRDLRGNPLTGLTLVEPRVRFRDGAVPPLLEARRVTVGYSAWALLTGRERAIELRAEQPLVRLSRGADGKLRLPQWKAGPRGRPGQPLQLHLVVRDGRLQMPRAADGVEGLDLDLEVRTGRATRATLAAMRWKRGPFRTVLQSLRGEAVLDDSVRVAVTELKSPELALRARAAWARAGGTKTAHVDLERVRWTLLARVFDNGAFDVPGEASLTLDARGDRTWRGDFRTALTWNGLAAKGTGGAAWDGRRLRVEPLEVTSKAGDLDGWVTYAQEAWAVGGDVDRGDPAQWGPIHIPGWPAGQLHGRFRYAVDTRVRGRPSSHLDALLGASLLAGWRVDSATVNVDFPWQRPVAFTVDAKRRGGGFGLVAATDPAGWSGTYQVRDLPLEEWPDGRASGLRGVVHEGAGTVRADASGLNVTGALAGTTSSWLGMSAARWRLEGVDGRLLPTPALSATARLADATYLGVHFDSATVAFALGDRVAALNRVVATAADTVVTVDGHARWDAAGWAVDLDHARARSAQFDWSADPPVRLSGDSRGVTFERLSGRDGDARLDISGRWAGPGGVYDWSLQASRLDLGRLGLPAEWDLGGRADARLDVHGVSGDPRWQLALDCSHPGTRGHAADSLHVTLAGAPGRAELSDGLLLIGEGRLAGALHVAGTPRPWPDTLTVPGVTRWLATAASWDGAFHGDRLPVERFASLAPDARGAGGALSGTLDLAGSPARPDLKLDASVARPRWQDFVADAVHALARYRDGRLTVESVRMEHKTLTSEAKGSMPLRLALGAPLAVPEDSMRWSLDVPSGDVAIVPLFVPQVASARGSFAGRATMTGTVRHPRLDGFARIQDAAVRLEGREEVLEHLGAEFRFSETRIALDSLTAREGVRGRVSADGVVNLRGLALQDYHFDLRLRDFTAVEQGLYAAAFSGDFVVTNGPRAGGQTLPMVEGKAQIERAAILFDFANQTEMQRLAATTVPLFWVYRVQVEAANNLHWQPPNGDIEFNADLTVEQTTDSLMVFGTMSALRGTYWFLSNRFTVDKADLTFDNVQGVDPTLDVSATTRIQGASETDPLTGNTTPGTAHSIVAAITGRSSKPTITLTDDASVLSQGAVAWDQPRILRELTLGTLSNQALIENNPVDNYVTRALNRTLSAEMSRLFQGYVSEWALDRERGGLFTGTGDVVATVGVPVGKNLSVRFRNRLGLAGADLRPNLGAPDDLFERNVEAEYRLNRFFYVTTEYVQPRVGRGITTLGTNTQPSYNVNLKARWEY